MRTFVFISQNIAIFEVMEPARGALASEIEHYTQNPYALSQLNGYIL